MRSARPIVGAVVVAIAVAATGLALPAQAVDKTWHKLRADEIERSRITLDIAKSVDNAIDTINPGKGGEANIEKCGVERTQGISVARNTRWDAGNRNGIVLIMQMKNQRGAKRLFNITKNKYLACTPENFGYDFPPRVKVNGRFIEKKKEIRLQWAIYEDATQTSTLKANGLTIRRMGLALIITRSTTQDLSTIKQSVNSQLTAKQSIRYKAAAFF